MLFLQVQIPVYSSFKCASHKSNKSCLKVDDHIHVRIELYILHVLLSGGKPDDNL